MNAPCIVCGQPRSPASAPWLSRCDSCGQWASQLVADFDDRRREDALDRQALGDSSTSLRRHNLARILDAAGPPGRLLDVGAGDGMAMELAADRGFSCVGVEPEPSLAGACKARGLQVHEGFFPADLPAQAPFDLVLFNHVLEHVSDPRAALTAARNLLAPDGRIVVHSPSAAGTLIRIAQALSRVGRPGALDRMWWRHFPSPLLHRFTPASLTQLANDLGLQVDGVGRTDPLAVRGLWGRLGAARGLATPTQAVLWLGLAGLAPALRVLPGDYFFLILRLSVSSR